MQEVINAVKSNVNALKHNVNAIKSILPMGIFGGREFKPLKNYHY